MSAYNLAVFWGMAIGLFPDVLYFAYVGDKEFLCSLKYESLLTFYLLVIEAEGLV